jgi:hypothetical protein
MLIMPVTLIEVREFVEENIGNFHERRLNKIMKQDLNDILKRKNPYLFKAKNITTASDFVRTVLDAYLSSQEETLFGEFLEKLAIFVCQRSLGGVKSSAEGIDLEFTKDDIRYLVTIKSGPNWGNSSQINKMVDNFKKATRILRTSDSRLNIRCVNGCCYGIENSPEKDDYIKFCGQDFWELISDNPVLYTDIIEPLGYRAHERNEAFAAAYAVILNKLTKEFLDHFSRDGVIDWEKLVRFNSASARFARTE